MEMMKTLKGVQVTEYPIEKLGFSVYVAGVEGGANHKKHKETLDKLGLVSIPYQKFFMAVLNSPDLLKKMKGKSAYVAGEGFDKDDVLAINEKSGELEQLKGGESPKKLVRTFSGKWPRLVEVDPGDFPFRRFYLGANRRPVDAASLVLVVLGIKPDQQAETALRVDRAKGGGAGG